MENSDWLTWFQEQWLILSPVLLSLVLRLIPTKKNWDIVGMFVKFIFNQIDKRIPNIKKGAGKFTTILLMLFVLNIGVQAQIDGYFKTVNADNLVARKVGLILYPDSNSGFFVNSVDTTFREWLNVAITDVTAASEKVNKTIYVDTTGNDNTGDGLTDTTAYRTIGRAIDDISFISSGIQIDIQLGKGTFDISDTVISEIERLEGSGTLRFLGTTVDYIDSVSLTHTNPSDLYKQEALVAGTDPNWSTNELVGYWLHNPDISVKYYYINSNTDSTIESGFAYYNASQLAGINEIISMETTINMDFSPSTDYIFGFGVNNIIFEALNMDVEARFNFDGSYAELHGVNWSNDRLQCIGTTDMHLKGSYAGNRVYHYSTNRNSRTQNTVTNSFYYLYGSLQLDRSILQGSIGLIMGNYGEWYNIRSEYTKFKSTNFNIYLIDNNCRIINTVSDTLIKIESGAYFVNLEASLYENNIFFVFPEGSITGSPTTGWVNGTLPYYINPIENFYFYINGVTEADLTYADNKVTFTDTVEVDVGVKFSDGTTQITASSAPTYQWFEIDSTYLKGVGADLELVAASANIAYRIQDIVIYVEAAPSPALIQSTIFTLPNNTGQYDYNFPGSPTVGLLPFINQDQANVSYDTYNFNTAITLTKTTQYTVVNGMKLYIGILYDSIDNTNIL